MAAQQCNQKRKSNIAAKIIFSISLNGPERCSANSLSLIVDEVYLDYLYT